MYWIGREMTADIDKYLWHSPECLECAELFSGDPQEHGEFYYNKNIRSIQTWESSTTWAMERSTLEKLMPLPDFGEQGPYERAETQPI
jgi:hypothetical protein